MIPLVIMNAMVYTQLAKPEARVELMTERHGDQWLAGLSYHFGECGRFQCIDEALDDSLVEALTKLARSVLTLKL